jgi:acyl-CoA hydrolase
MKPIIERLYGGHPDLRFVELRAKGELPDNIVLNEFYYPPGSLLGSESAQRQYTCVNFTDVYREILESDLDLIAQLVAPADGRYDLSCNPDLSLALFPKMLTMEKRPMLVAQTNERIPRLGRSAEVEADTFDAILDNRELDYEPFSMPSMPPSDAEYAIGLRVASLLRDGGTIQVGIGNLGETVSWASILRHQNSEAFRRVFDALPHAPGTRELVEEWGGYGHFEQGLYASSEMFVEGLLHMYDAGILSREVDDGVVLHGAFYLGSPRFYERLRTLTDDDRARLEMTSVLWTNLLYGDEELKRAQRRDARFINEGMKVTGLGAIVSDGLEDGRVVSGVGGQYEFVSQAHGMADARAIMMVSAIRESSGDVTSNVIWNYGHTTIPRHLRDIVVTEYGVADLRGKTDEEIVHALVEVMDARFQDQFVRRAKDAQKIARDYTPSDRARQNRPETLTDALAGFRQDGIIPDTPFGSELTDTELELVGALRTLQSVVDDTTAGRLPEFSGDALEDAIDIPDAATPYLERMELADPSTLREELLRRAVVYGLSASGAVDDA